MYSDGCPVAEANRKAGFDVALQNRQDEPKYVNRIAKYLVEILNAHAQTSLYSRQKIHLSFGSAFVHQAPKVKNLTTGKSCEAGDLLILLRDVDCHGAERYNSILLQAKMADGNKVWSPDPTKTEYVQYELYNTWPQVSINVANATGGTTTQTYLMSKGNSKISPNSPHSGAQYLFLHRNRFYADGCASYVAPSSSPFATDAFCLANVLCGVLRFTNGMEIEDKNSKTKSEWSRFIWDLIAHAKVVESKNFKRIDKGDWWLERVFGGNVMHFMTADDFQNSTIGGSSARADEEQVMAVFCIEQIHEKEDEYRD